MQGHRARHSVVGMACGLAAAITLGTADLALAAGHADGAAQANAAAQRPGRGRAPGNPDFWFGAPSGFVRVHTGRLFARGGSDLFDFLNREFTFDDRAFDATGVGVSVGAALGSRAEALFGVDVNRTSNTTEYRDFVGSDGLPIQQDTALTEVDVTGSFRFNLVPNGRQISSLAWIPTTVTPYVGAGGGALWYQLRQEGDFVDFVDSSIFRSRFESRGWTPSAHVFGGADVQVWKRLFLALEARYVWASAELGRDFAGFDPIDLSGLRLTVGVNVAF